MYKRPRKSGRTQRCGRLSVVEQLEPRILLFGTSIHESIISGAGGLPFLKDSVQSDLIAEQRNQDNLFGSPQYEQANHFDGSHFQEAAKNIRGWYKNAVESLNPTVFSGQDASAAFGKILHALQDFYAHSNWVELQDAGKIAGKPLIDETNGSFPELKPYSIHSGVMIVQGENETPFGEKSSWSRDGLIVTVHRDGQPNIPGLITGSVLPVPYGGDDTPNSIAVSHGGLAGSWLLPESLGKDSDSKPLFNEARELAVEQTRHEFKRLCHLVNAAPGYGTEKQPNRGAINLIKEWVKPDDDSVATALELCGFENSPPIANDDDIEIAENGTVIINILSNDVASEGAPLLPGSVFIVGQPIGNGRSYSVDDATGAITFTPPNGFSGETSIIYSVEDVFHRVDSARVTISVIDDPSNNPGNTGDTVPKDERGIATEFYDGLPEDAHVVTATYEVSHEFDYKEGVAIEHANTGFRFIGYWNIEHVTSNGFDSFGGERTLLKAGITSRVEYHVEASTNGYAPQPPDPIVDANGRMREWWSSGKKVETTNRGIIGFDVSTISVGQLLNIGGDYGKNPDSNVYGYTEVRAESYRIEENYVEVDVNRFLDSETTIIGVSSYSMLRREYGADRILCCNLCCSPLPAATRDLRIITQDNSIIWEPTGPPPFAVEEYFGAFEYSISVHFAYLGNAAPVASDDNVLFDFFEPHPLVIDVLANDTDADEDNLTAVLVSNVKHGTLRLNQDDAFEYVADAGFTGVDTFTYVANDGQLDSNVATVTIHVGLNTAPVANDDSFEFDPSDPDRLFNVLLNDTDADGDALTAERVVGEMTHGVVLFSEDGVFGYFPSDGFTGIDTFTYVASDGQATSNVATVTIRVGVAEVPADLTRNGFVDFEDLTVLLAAWNQNVSAAEGNLVDAGSSPVNFEDLTVLLAAWTGPG
ncbi:MAG: tandem-95 repeat protein, partial [Planctomycetes bacterium]|nr:tandem-95 repeat protein [Planctomycetota bacterium]